MKRLDILKCLYNIHPAKKGALFIQHSVTGRICDEKVLFIFFTDDRIIGQLVTQHTSFINYYYFYKKQLYKSLCFYGGRQFFCFHAWFCWLDRACILHSKGQQIHSTLHANDYSKKKDSTLWCIWCDLLSIFVLIAANNHDVVALLVVAVAWKLFVIIIASIWFGKPGKKKIINETPLWIERLSSQLWRRYTKLTTMCSITWPRLSTTWNYWNYFTSEFPIPIQWMTVQDELRITISLSLSLVGLPMVLFDSAGLNAIWILCRTWYMHRACILHSNSEQRHTTQHAE